MNPDPKRVAEERQAIIKMFGSVYAHGQTLDQSKIEPSATDVPISLNVQNGLQKFIDSTKRLPPVPTLSPPPTETEIKHGPLAAGTVPPVPPVPEAIQAAEPAPIPVGASPPQPVPQSVSVQAPPRPEEDPNQITFDFGDSKGMVALHEKYDTIIKNQKKILDYLQRIEDSMSYEG